MLVFAACTTVIAVFADAIAGVSMVLTVNRPCADHHQIASNAVPAETALGSAAQNHHQVPTQFQS